MSTPARLDTRYLPGGAPRARVPYRIYRFWGVRHRQWLAWRLFDRLTRGLFATDVLLYVGQTGRVPIHRLGEHLADKSWAGDVRAWEVDDREYATEQLVLAVEERVIRIEWPVHNVQHNDVGAGRPNARGPRWRARRRVADRLARLVVLWLVLAGLLRWAGLSHWGGTGAAKAATVVLVAAVVLRRPARRSRRRCR